jgi:hypothetical protein
MYHYTKLSLLAIAIAATGAVGYWPPSTPPWPIKD